MAARRAWYRAGEYKQAFDAKVLGDGSIVGCTQTTTDGCFVLTRLYPFGYRQEIHFRLLPSGETKYHREDPGPASPMRHLTPAERTAAFERDLANGLVRPTLRGPVPGAGLGVTTDEAMGRQHHFGQSDEWERIAMENQVGRALRSDSSTVHYEDDPAPVDIGIKTFDASRPGATPPLPSKRA